MVLLCTTALPSPPYPMRSAVAAWVEQQAEVSSTHTNPSRSTSPHTKGTQKTVMGISHYQQTTRQAAVPMAHQRCSSTTEEMQTLVNSLELLDTIGCLLHKAITL